MLLIVIFALSFIATWSVIKLSGNEGRLINQNDLKGVQKFHQKPVPRLGGLSVFFAWLVAALLINDQSSLFFTIWLSSLPVFIVALYEDLSGRVSPLIRLVFTFVSIVIVFFWLDLKIDSLGFELVDYVLENYAIASLLFTLLVLGGAVNSLNIIDGFNGILGGYIILAFLAMSYVAYILGDELILQISLISIFSTLGFFIFNFPFGKIFMGDAGAYFLGFILAIIGIVLVDRNQSLSNWFVLAIFIYPMYELLYSIYRRKIIHKTSASQPDANHLHSLVYRKLISCDRFKHNKVICNSMTAPIMWVLSLFGIIPAVVWFDNQTMLIVAVFIFMIIYTVFYRYIVSDKIKFTQ